MLGAASWATPKASSSATTAATPVSSPRRRAGRSTAHASTTSGASVSTHHTHPQVRPATPVRSRTAAPTSTQGTATTRSNVKRRPPPTPPPAPPTPAGKEQDGRADQPPGHRHDEEQRQAPPPMDPRGAHRGRRPPCLLQHRSPSGQTSPLTVTLPLEDTHPTFT